MEQDVCDDYCTCVCHHRADRGKSAFSAHTNWLFLESANQLFAVSHHRSRTDTLICSILTAESS